MPVVNISNSNETGDYNQEEDGEEDGTECDEEDDGWLS